MNYQQSLDYLFSLTHSGIKLGLENTRKILAHFNNPQIKTRTIHIAGTNGKGSTAAFMESILRSAGYRVGLYTSPHLMDFRERIQIDRKMIGKGELAALVHRVKEATATLNIKPTFFEFTTVIAFIYFHEKAVNWNVIETGLGGRLDSTNLCHAEISIITSIGMDHTKYLGNSLKAIVSEKAEIIKEGGIVIAGIDDSHILKTIIDKASKCNAPVYSLNKNFKVEPVEFTDHNLIFDYWGVDKHFQQLNTPLLGKYQATNAAMAVTAALILDNMDCEIPGPSIRKGLQTTHWAGRLEVAGTRPTVLLDCAHNPDSVKELASAIRDHFTYKRCTVILGIMDDKAIEQIIETIDVIADHVILVKPRQKRSADPKILLEKFGKSQKVVEIIEEIHYALHTAHIISNPDDIICVTGSIFTVAEAKQSIENEGFI